MTVKRLTVCDNAQGSVDGEEKATGWYRVDDGEWRKL